MTSTSKSSSPTDVRDYFIENAFQERSPEETCSVVYTKWAATYDKDMVDTKMYGPEAVVEEFVKLRLDKNVHILDVGAGTGCIANLLQKHGYTNIDALDGCIDMLEIAKSRDLYRNYFIDIISEGKKNTIKDGTYDVLIMSGVFCPGHLDATAFNELIRITKSGGVICWSMRAPHIFGERSEKFQARNFETGVENLCKSGKWKMLKDPKPINYFNNFNGFVYMMQVL